MMLGAIVVLGIAGGALAFKATKFSAVRYCTAPLTTTQCDNALSFTQSTFTAMSNPELHYSVIANGFACFQISCPNVGVSKFLMD